MPGPTLYVWGGIPFEVYPLNVEGVRHLTETDWAPKEIVGAATHYEWVGENPEEVHFRGKCFPHFFVRHGRRSGGGGSGAFGAQQQGPASQTSGGVGHLDVIDNMRRLAHVHVLVRGDGWHLGWFAIKRLNRDHSHLGVDGIGQQLEFEVEFLRFPTPQDPSNYFSAFAGVAP